MRKTQRGLTLIELMVAMGIGLAVTLVVTTLLLATEQHKSTTTSTNDADQTGSYAFNALDRALRGAGSGFVQSAYPQDVGVMGCKLSVASILPHSAAFPAPFAALLSTAPDNLRVAPVLIARNQSDGGSDVLVVMGGSGAAGGVSRPVSAAGNATTLTLQNAVGFSQNDLVLVSQSGKPDCLLEQVHSIASATLTLDAGDPYYTLTGATNTLASLAADLTTYVTPLGNTQANNVQFQFFGVGTNNVLYSYDLLQGTGSDVSQAIADGVVSLKALYGVQVSTSPGVLSNWVAPTGTYAINTVMTTPATMESIIAVHVAVVVRGAYPEKTPSQPATLTIFNGFMNGTTSLAQTINLDQHYRYRVFEFTVPLRNMLLLAGAGSGP